jgi:fermentation-respiration switch protein FrsA (DUF1100 family)
MNPSRDQTSGRKVYEVGRERVILTLTTKHGATYKGKRNADGTEIAGEWTKQGRSLRGLEVIAGEEVAVAGESTKRGRTLPLTLKRSDPSKVVVAPPIPGELEGFWQGNWRIGLMDLRLFLRVKKARDGRLKAMLASPDQGTSNIPISAIELKGDTLTFESKLIAAFTEYDTALPEAEKKALADAGGTVETTIGQLNNAWIRSLLAFDPRPTLRKVRCPVLAVDGEKDLQVPSKENLAEIEKALKAGGNSDVRAIEFRGLNHLFQPCKTGSPTEYAQIEMTIAPEVLKVIGDWIVEKVGSH